MSTRGAPPGSASCLVASIPSMTGMRTSMRTTSGPSCRLSSTASAPSLAVPTTVKSGCVSSSAANPARTIWWSSATMILIAGGASVIGSCLSRRRLGRDGQAGLNHEAAGVPGACAQLAADRGRALAHAEQPVPADLRRSERAEGAGPRGTGAVVADAQHEGVCGVVQLDVDGGALRVPARVRQRLLDDAVGGQLDARVKRGHGTGDDEADARPRGVACLLEEVIELPQAGLGLPVGDTAPGVLAQDAEQPPHLGEGGPGGVADGGQ